MEEKLNAILDSIRQLEKRVTDIENDLAHDRGDIQNLTISNGQVVAEVGELRRSVNLLSDKVRNRVAEAVEPIIESTENLTAQVEKSKMIVLKETKKRWWQKIFKL